ncbi:transglutaminase domain-containing protein [Paenibacillus mesophilus]|uniref:transglutaminase TgpA family protein n=1 Tax=Paenibacillus mesophilus TaxID=2582849 RepID=UPI00110E7B19|nr:transglutaminase domain-containing protein [Paenibacillus mesophilus]TMV46951.1 transglutaminase domain-containing protein [Paenibacillus mesophilus]
MEQRLWKRLLTQDWHERLTAILTGLFLLQFVEWIQKEDYVWLPETVAIVKLTLLVVFVAELFPRLHPGLRRLLQAIGIFYVLGTMLDYAPVGRPFHSIRDFGAFTGDLGLLIRDNFMQFVPFVWFALSAWLIALFTFWWMKAKWRIMVALVLSVAAFAFRDSFSFLVLWLQVAILIFCGLFLLIIRHFAGLKKRNPSGWAHLSDYPLNISLPIVFLVSLVVFLGTLAPDVRALVTDPYTLWKNFRGEQITFFNKGFGTTSVLGGDSSSGYSRNDSTLGGEFSFDYTPVMSISTSHRSYWRGETRSLYTGKGWITSDVERRTPLVPVTADTSLPQDPRLAPTLAKTVEVTQTISVLGQTEQDYPVLFGAYAIDKVVATGGANVNMSALQWASRLGELRWMPSGRVPYPQMYMITSKVPIVDETELRKVPAELPTRVGLEENLFLPETLPNRVRELAQQVTASGTNMYDKVKLLERYLNSTYPYTNTPDLSKGRSRDFVDRFLFEIKEGYCDYYSTAMAVMARSLGIPARWVKGYTPGASAMAEDMLNFPEELIDPDGAGEYTVRNSDAHSWVEIYFPGYGWIPFEPTAGFALPVFAPEEEISTELLPATSDETASSLSGDSVMPRAIGWGAGVIAAAILIAFLWANRHMLWKLRRFAPIGRQLDANQKAILEFERLIRFARRKGYSRSEHETAREMANRWIGKDKWLQKDLDSLLFVFEKAKYSGSRITEEELSSFSRTVSKLREEM